MGTYIIHFDDKPWQDLDDELYYRCFEIPWFSTTDTTISRLTPYTEPDLEQVRKEAYENGLSDAWEAARKIYGSATKHGLPTEVITKIFRDDGKENFNYWDIVEDFSPAEAIERIRQYEQEKDRQVRIEYNFDEVKDVIETTAKEYNMSLDEIAEVLKKMGEH